MPNTYGTFTGSGGNKTFAIPFSNWLNDSHVIVRVAGVNYDKDSSSTAYDFTISGTNVVFDAVVDGIFFYILRDTLGKDHDSTSLLYDFTDGSIVTADQMDDVYRQNFYLAQEAAEKVPSLDTGWIDTFDTSLGGDASLAATSELHILTGTDLRTVLPLKIITILGKNSGGDEFQVIPTVQNTVYDHSGSATTYTIGIDLEYKVSGTDYYFILETGDYAGVNSVAFGGLVFVYHEWATSVDKIRFTVS